MFGEWQHGGLRGYLLELGAYHRIVFPENEDVFRSHVLEDAEFCIDIVLHQMFIAVEVVGSDIHQYGYVGFEVVHIVELE